MIRSRSITTHNHGINLPILTAPLSDKKRCAIIIRGESFRTGSQDSRVRGLPESVAGQISAAQSHIQLAEKLVSMGYNPHMYVITYRTAYTDMLLDVYRPFLVNSAVLENLLNSQNALINTALSMINYDAYDYILIIRIDNQFKEAFFDAFTLGDAVTFISVCWYMYRKTPRGNPRINDMYYQIPRACVPYLKQAIERNAFGHDILDHVNIPHSLYRFMTSQYYDSDSEKDYNPFYRIVNRPESLVTHSEGVTYPADF